VTSATRELLEWIWWRAIEAGVCLPGQFVVDIHGALLEANEANVTPAALLLCCD
jgi:hypothetical protein